MTNYTTPDKWVVVKLPDTHKVFATWYGGYLDSASWKLNSGIEKVEQDEDFYYFYGYSGSVYKCHKNSYGTNSYTSGILRNMIETLKNNTNIVMEILPSDFNFVTLSHENENTR